MKVYINQLEHAKGLELPYYATLASAGMDLMAAIKEHEEIILAPGEVQLIPSGIVIALPFGYEAQIRPRSGLALKHKVTILNTPGTIDADYRGEIKVMLINHGKEPFVIERGMRIAQMIITKHERVEWEPVNELDETARGKSGFGSTGLKG